MKHHLHSNAILVGRAIKHFYCVMLGITWTMLSQHVCPSVTVKTAKQITLFHLRTATPF